MEQDSAPTRGQKSAIFFEIFLRIVARLEKRDAKAGLCARKQVQLALYSYGQSIHGRRT